MRHSTWIAVLAATSTLVLAGCQRSETVKAEKHERHHRRDPVRTISKLDCPEMQGDLKRVSAAADGLSCAYAGVDADVLLRLVSLNNGDAEDALAPIETELKALMPTLKPVTDQKPGEKSDRNKTSIHLPACGSTRATTGPTSRSATSRSTATKAAPPRSRSTRTSR